METASSLQAGRSGIVPGLSGAGSQAAAGSLARAGVAGAGAVAPVEPVPPVPLSPRLLDGQGAQAALGRTQQGMAWLDELGGRLDTLQGQLARLPQGGSGAAVERELAALQPLLQARATDAGGQVDAQLRPSDGAARVEFRVRGLDMAALAAEGDETLRLTLPGARQLAVPLVGGEPRSNLLALQRALAGSGVTVQARGGDLSFSAPESDLPRLRDGLALRGDGRRFPGGQPVRAQIQAESEAVQPARIAQWLADGREGQRKAMGQVFELRDRVARARGALQQRLDELAPRPSGATPEQMQALAEDFAAGNTAPRLDYGRLSDLLAAVRGVHRDRVDQLLR